MFRIVVTCALFYIAAAAVIPDDKTAEIIRYENNNDGAGNYKFSYETSNGITREESGHLVNVGGEDEHMEVEGSYSYTDVDGKFVIVRYTAGEEGFKTYEPVIGVPETTYGVPPGVVASLLG